MGYFNSYPKKLCLIAVGFCLAVQVSKAQTDVDAIMLNKKVLCVGVMYSHSSWKDYWEGEFKRNNGNLGTVSTQMYSAMGNYGITNKLNFLFNMPYVQTKASAGTLKGLNGLQDLSLMLKWMPVVKHLGKKGIISAYGIGGISFPVSDYAADFLPLSLGLHSRNLGLRGMIDYQYGNFFATASGVYMKRSNINIDRTSYYTTEMHYTDRVDIPDAAGYNLRAGFRSNTWIAEAVLENMTTLGGFDIRKNDMPFPSNRMNATQAGVNIKYTLSAVPGLELIGGAKYTVSGRNMGQATAIYGGVFYIMNLSGKNNSNGNTKTTEP